MSGRGGESRLELGRSEGGDVGRRTRLEPPPLVERADIDHVEAEGVDQRRDRGLGRRIVAADEIDARIKIDGDMFGTIETAETGGALSGSLLAAQGK